MSLSRPRVFPDISSGTEPETKSLHASKLLKLIEARVSALSGHTEGITGWLVDPAAADLLAHLQGEVVKLRNELERLRDKKESVIVPITTFAPEPYELRQEMKVVVQPSSDESYVASLFDASLSMTGETETDAVANLKAWILDVYDDLEEQPEGALGSGPQRQLAVLRTFIQRRD